MTPTPLFSSRITRAVFAGFALLCIALDAHLDPEAYPGDGELGAPGPGAGGPAVDPGTGPTDPTPGPDADTGPHDGDHDGGFKPSAVAIIYQAAIDAGMIARVSNAPQFLEALLSAIDAAADPADPLGAASVRAVADSAALRYGGDDFAPFDDDVVAAFAGVLASNAAQLFG